MSMCIGLLSDATTTFVNHSASYSCPRGNICMAKLFGQDILDGVSTHMYRPHGRVDPDQSLIFDKQIRMPVSHPKHVVEQEDKVYRR